MADQLILAIPGKEISSVKAGQKNHEPMSLVQGVKKLLGITNWSELTRGEEPYFGF